MRLFEVTDHCEEMAAVWQLVYRVYLEEGYCEKDAKKRLRHYKILDCQPETTVFCVEEEDTLLGTCTVTLDGPRGIHTDFVFPVETQAVRDECRCDGLKLASSWRIATDPCCRSKTAVVNMLMNATIEKLLRERVDVSLYTFNPKHEKVYHRLWGFVTIAGPKEDATVKGAPAILMRGDSEFLKEKLAARKRKGL